MSSVAECELLLPHSERRPPLPPPPSREREHRGSRLLDRTRRPGAEGVHRLRDDVVRTRVPSGRVELASGIDDVLSGVSMHRAATNKDKCCVGH
jgi:hypothetical protein